MADALSTSDSSSDRPALNPSRLGSVALCLFVATLAWAPFPLGSNRAWSWNLLLLLVALCWGLWSLSLWRGPPSEIDLMRRLRVPLLLYAAALLWAFIQTLSSVPSSWVHPVWGIASEGLGQSLEGTISLNPWRTQTALLNLSGYGLVGLLAAMMARSRSRATLLLDAVIAIGGFYAAYAFILSMIGVRQAELFYSTPFVGNVLAAPFVNRNSLATYMGLMTICALVRLVEMGSESVVAGRGWRPLALSLLQLLFGRGTPVLVAAILTFSALIATGSRAGFLATLTAMVVMMLLAAVIARRRMTLGWTLATGVALALGAIVLFVINGETLGARLNALVETQGQGDLRLILWDAAQRMIGDAPWLGLGLGTFEDAYPLYADRTLPYMMDKAHNDFLELAAGLGLPAALALWSAIGLLAFRCLRGVFTRRRDRHFAMLGLAATTLVGVHSAFDFNLQIPAIALTYAAILGLSVGQSFPSRDA